FAPVKVPTLNEWSSYGREHRSWGFHLHAWECMDPLLREYDETRDQKWVTAAVDIAISWLELHRDAGYEDPMACYDMSQALRMALRRTAQGTGLQPQQQPWVLHCGVSSSCCEIRLDVPRRR